MNIRRFAAAIATASLMGCAAPTVTLEHAGLAVTLPPEFVDDTHAAIERYHLDERSIALAEGRGLFIESLLKFENASGARTQGGCDVAKVRLTPLNVLHAADVRQVIRQAGSHFVRVSQDKDQNEGRVKYFKPWMPAQSVTPESSQAALVAGLEGWQETWRVHWAPLAGPVQAVSLVMFMMADLPQPRQPHSDRLSLQVMCAVVDLEPYVQTSMNDVLAVIKTLRIAR